MERLAKVGYIDRGTAGVFWKIFNGIELVTERYSSSVSETDRGSLSNFISQGSAVRSQDGLRFEKPMRDTDKSHIWKTVDRYSKYLHT